MLWLVSEKQELLLARRADNKRQDPGLWGPSVTGKLEKRETYSQALARETEEELGLTINDYKPEYLFEIDFAHPDGEVRHFAVYAARVKKTISNKIIIDKNEVDQVRWASMIEVKKLLQTKPGEVLPASAFVLWQQVFSKLNYNNVLFALRL